MNSQGICSLSSLWQNKLRSLFSINVFLLVICVMRSYDIVLQKFKAYTFSRKLMYNAEPCHLHFPQKMIVLVWLKTKTQDFLEVFPRSNAYLRHHFALMMGYKCAQGFFNTKEMGNVWLLCRKPQQRQIVNIEADVTLYCLEEYLRQKL